jgi:mono/diheme cytochrome c family protein
MITFMIPSFRSRCPLLAIIAALAINAICPVNTATATDAEARSILAANCQKCHGPSKQKSGLRLDSRDGALRKGDSGSPAIVPGKAAASEVMRRVTAKNPAERMPPDGAGLTAAQIDVLRKWIDAGAAWPSAGMGPANLARTELVVTDEDRQHWAFKPFQKIEVPFADRARASIDRFLLHALAAKKLTPARPADPRVLIRRVAFDITGLPPTPNEVEAFVRAKDSDAAYEALVDRLLASRHYGERWGRHWLDVARYADSDGYESDADRPNAYHYRDFVIKALNDDMPFDEFVRRQLAGDEIAPDDPQAVAATGFLAAGPSETLPDNLLEEERQRSRYNDLDDIVSTTGAALLGLTVGCARCHDHKFDPIPTRDYYRLLAGLHSGDRADVPLGARAEIERTSRARAEWDKQRRAAEGDFKQWLDGQRTALEPRLRAAKIDRLPISDAEKALLKGSPDSAEAKQLRKKHEKALAITNDEVRNAADDASRRRGEELAGRLAALKKEEPKALPHAFAFKDMGPKPAASWLFRRGDFHDRAIPVELGFLTVLTRGKPAADYWNEARAGANRTDTTHQRRALAAWVTDADRGAGPLLARVIVNRLWQHHFGEGLVRTPNDFGARGDRPTHPELLEWLAADLVAHGWKLKRVHRMILLSAAYRQGDAFDPEKAKADPDNRLLWRMRPRRLEGEVLRDALLAVAGTLNTEMYGPAFKAPIPADAMVARNIKTPYPTDIPDSSAVRRRSVYLFHKRVIPYPLLQAFDAPDAQQCTGRRANTTVVPQALALLNDPFVRARAADFAARLLKESADDPASCVENAYRLAFSRTPTEAEKTAGVEFLAAQERERSSRQPEAAPAEIRRATLNDYCQVLFGLNEFIYVD